MDREAQRSRLVAIVLDTASIGRASPDVEHERAVAIYDLVEDSSFEPVGHDAGGPYRLVLSLAENRLSLDIRSAEDEPVALHILSLASFRRVVKDYSLVCESYQQSIRSGSPSRIEAIDMGRRGIHDDGARLLQERLDGKVMLNFTTARRLFTLLHVLHRRG